jgi:hypothetical protein
VMRSTRIPFSSAIVISMMFCWGISVYLPIKTS